MNIFNKELTFSNTELLKAAVLAVAEGYKVHTFKPSGCEISQIYIDNQVTFGTISASYSGVRYGTCHKGDESTGTGFGFGGDSQCASIEMIKATLDYAPKWAFNCRGKVVKASWAEHLAYQSKFSLVYAEITSLVSREAFKHNFN